MLLSIIIPAYNESACIDDVIEKTNAFFAKRADFQSEIIVVNDCSTDNTSYVLDGLQRKFTDLVCLHNEENMGKGFSVRRGLLKAKGDYILFMDADLSTPLNQFDILWKNMAKADVAIASRALPESVILKHQTKIKENIAKMGNRLIRMCLRLPFHDTQCGFKLFSRKASEIFKYQTINRWGFDMEVLFIAKKCGLKIIEAPIVWSNDDTSSVRKLDYLVVFFDIFKILFNDLIGKYKINTIYV